MRNKLFSVIKPLFKSVLLVGLVLTLALSNADGALAARSGGRIGGGSFRAPSRGPTYSAPRSYTPGPGGYRGGYGYGGGYTPSPFFFIPFLGGTGGLGGLFGILIFFAIANFLVSTFRRVSAGTDGEGLDAYSSNPAVSVAKLQVGLLAEARTLQADLNRIAEAADTSSSDGLTQVLQESSLALLRHPEYWVYAGSESQQTRLSAAESQFNRLALAERSKFGEETLTNFNTRRQLKSANDSALTVAEAGGALTNTTQAPSEYIVVTILVGTQGKFQFPAINNSDELRRALSQIGAIPSEQLLAVEILWTPQAEDDTLTTDDMLAEYPNLKLV
ncbi:MAG: DUF1517 domain-containing protein [Trichocoleus desertorum ATA4-8-CV12]|jgi:uncharacterized membrane protein|nr:DUF1517 domain-containing protein [Trichocoleus desertorum ATA4-8-CV12]